MVSNTSVFLLLIGSPTQALVLFVIVSCCSKDNQSVVVAERLFVAWKDFNQSHTQRSHHHLRISTDGVNEIDERSYVSKILYPNTSKPNVA